MSNYFNPLDLPEVTPTEDPELVEVNGRRYFIGKDWTAERRRTEALESLAIAEYLDSFKPKLPTEPGRVILATRIKDNYIRPAGIYLSLRDTGDWANLVFNQTFKPSDIEDWKPVQLHVVEVCP